MPAKGGKRLCIIGGGGYLGCTLAAELQRFGHQVVIFDWSFCQDLLPDGVITVQVWIAKYHLGGKQRFSLAPLEDRGTRLMSQLPLIMAH